MIDRIKGRAKIHEYKHRDVAIIDGSNNVIMNVCNRCLRWWFGRYTDWWTGSRQCWFTWRLSLLTTKRSISFERKLKLEIGRNDIVSSGSRVDSLFLGRTKVCLWLFGKCRCANDDLIVPFIIGPRMSSHFFTNHVGTGSHCFDAATTSRVTLFKQLSGETNLGRINGGGAPAVDVCIVAIFSVK